MAQAGQAFQVEEWRGGDFRKPLRRGAIAKLIPRDSAKCSLRAAVLLRGIQRGSKARCTRSVARRAFFPSLYTIRRRGLFTTPELRLQRRTLRRSL